MTNLKQKKLKLICEVCGKKVKWKFSPVCEECITVLSSEKSEEKPYLCPVCGGRGFVPIGFYYPNSSTGSFSARCQTCGGRGIVWKTNSYDQP